MVLGIILGILAALFAAAVPVTALYYGHYKYQEIFMKV